MFKSNSFRKVQNLYQDKASMDITLIEFKKLTSLCWNEKYQNLSIGITKDEYTGRYRLGIYSNFIPETNAF